VPFKPGQSGNPGGRPKVLAEVRGLAQRQGREAVKRLIQLMRSENESVALRAAVELLDRGYGKPIQGVAVTGDAPPILVIGLQQPRHDPLALPAPQVVDQEPDDDETEITESALDVSRLIEAFRPKGANGSKV
jgi:hypothetical protein